MRTLLLAAAFAAVPLSGCATYPPSDDWAAQYRPGTYEPYALGPQDVVYRGENDRYYCHRRDGTVGLVVGAGVGALLGSAIAPHGSKTIGAIIGGAAGGAAGASIERNQVSCQ